MKNPVNAKRLIDKDALIAKLKEVSNEVSEHYKPGLVHTIHYIESRIPVDETLDDVLERLPDQCLVVRSEGKWAGIKFDSDIGEEGFDSPMEAAKNLEALINSSK